MRAFLLFLLFIKRIGHNILIFMHRYHTAVNLRQSRITFASLPELAMNLQDFNLLIAVASRKTLSANTNSSAFAVAFHSSCLLRKSKHYLRCPCRRSRFFVQRRTPRVGLCIGMFARVIVARSDTRYVPPGIRF